MENNSFQYQLQLCDGYILCRLTGEADADGYEEATQALLKSVAESGVRRVLYDARRLDTSNSRSFYRKTIACFMLISSRTDRLATYIPSLNSFAKAKFFSLATRGKNWKPFRRQEQAIAWLTAK